MKQLLSLASRLRAKHLLVCLMFLLGLPLTASAIDTVYINSQDNWTNFCSKYNDTEVNVLLNCDVTINTKGYQMKKFKGTLDGQGHAFIIDYKDDKSEAQNEPYYDKNWNRDSAPFKNASGTIKNLRITGTVAIRYGSFAYRMNNPLVEELDDDDKLIVENCHCDVAFVNTGTRSPSGFGNTAHIGGFIGEGSSDCTAIFNDCSFTGSIIYTDPNYGYRYFATGGFIGYGYGSNVYINNCFSHITYDDSGSVGELSYFVGVYYGGSINVDNSYGYCVNLKGKRKTLANTEKCSDFTTDAFWAQFVSNGGITRFLNQRGDTTAYKWVQTIGTDSVPRLRTFFPTSLEVFYKDATTHETTANGWSSFISPYDISLPEGVTPYVVTGINESDKKVTVSPYSGSIARVPLLLHTDGEAQTITVPAGYYNKYNAVGYLRGTYDDLTADDKYRVVEANGNFVKPTATIPAWSCYLPELTADSYTIDISDGDYGTIVVINSNDDWNDFCTNYSGKKVTAYLATDLTLTDTDKRIEEFVGTFDGQGHCITDNSQQTSVFPKAQGTIKNLRVEYLKEKCALVGYISGNINYVDCKAASALWLRTPMTNDIIYSHVLEYINNKWLAAYGENTSSTEVTEEQLTSGYAAYHLNAGRTGSDAVWTQTIGEDNTPQLMSKTSKEVFQAAATTREATSDKWATLFFPANIDLSSNADLHIYDDFRLTGDSLYCNENLTGQLMASTPAIIYCESGLPQITLPESYYNKVEPTTELIGVYADTDASTLNTLTTETVEDGTETVLFATPAAGSTTLPAWQCYTTSAAKVVDDGAVITSKDDWNKFKSRYSGRSVNARLATDLTLTDDDAPMTSFKGTFDGQGHTITVDYSRGTENSHHAPFQQAAGTIKNLQLAGTISIKNNSTAGRIYAAPLVSGLKGSSTETVTLNVENCHSSVTFQEDNVGKGLLDAGGFVRETSAYTTLNFTDCSFTGTFNTPGPLSGVGCFVGNTSDYNSIGFTFTNCFSDASGSTFGSIATNGASYLVRSLKSSNSLTVTNCSAVKVGDFNAHTTQCTLNLVDSATAASGSQAYALNAGRTGSDAKWTQTIGSDAVPQLKLFATDSKEVHEANGGDYKLSTAGWGTLYYPGDVTLDNGVKAYTVSNVEEKTTDGTTENYVVLTAVEGSTLPAYTAAILCSLAEGETTATEKTIPLATYYYNDAKEQTEGEGMTAMLYGVLEPTEAPDGSYVMQNQGGKVAFYQVDASVAQPTIPAFRSALLWVPKDDQQSSAKVNLRFDDEATGINGANVLEPLLNDGPVYDLQGRKVQSLQKNHIYIKNGQKFIIR